jgi:hypothetical protein
MLCYCTAGNGSELKVIRSPSRALSSPCAQHPILRFVILSFELIADDVLLACPCLCPSPCPYPCPYFWGVSNHQTRPDQTRLVQSEIRAHLLLHLFPERFWAALCFGVLCCTVLYCILWVQERAAPQRHPWGQSRALCRAAHASGSCSVTRTIGGTGRLHRSLHIHHVDAAVVVGGRRGAGRHPEQAICLRTTRSETRYRFYLVPSDVSVHDCVIW